ncbi:MAG: helix-turn-helix domain-containing protein [Polyangiales bacterium]
MAARKARDESGATGVQLGEDTVRAMVMAGGAMVFTERGLRAASVEDILLAAKVSRRTFYRLFDGKEAVMMALYHVGTESLLGGCRIAVAEESEPMRQLGRCIDVHLNNAQGLGRLVFLLGGEAQRHDSPLYARRTLVHNELGALLGGTGAFKRIDPWLIRGVILALEGIVRLMLDECDGGRQVTPAAVKRARSSMQRIATATLAGQGEGVAKLPKQP